MRPRASGRFWRSAVRPGPENELPPTIVAVSEAHPPAGEDPNSSTRGARQRWGPFWIEEPSWYWVVAALTLAAGLGALALLLVFDHP